MPTEVFKFNLNFLNPIETAQVQHQIQSHSLEVLEHPYIRFSKCPFHITSKATSSILGLLRILNELNTLWAHFSSINYNPSAPKFLISPTEFINNKVTSKLLRQLQDPLTLCSGALPQWCKELASQCSFLFPFECRKLYYCCTSFGIARALQSIQQNIQGSSRNELRIGRIQRQKVYFKILVHLYMKVRISREKILESGMKVMELYGKTKAVLEVEYFNEVGTGLVFSLAW